MTAPFVEYPAMRDEIRYAVSALSDEAFQNEVWVRGNLPRDNYLYDFDAPFHTLLDDVDLFSDDTKLVGKVLASSVEAEALKFLGTALLDLVADIGREGTLEQARASARWPPCLRRRRTP